MKQQQPWSALANLWLVAADAPTAATADAAAKVATSLFLPVLFPLWESE